MAPISYRRHRFPPVARFELARLPEEVGPAAGTDKIAAALGLDAEAHLIPVVPVSAHSGEGMKELWNVIDVHLEASGK